ncbi:MAG TPA: hypothetical protein VD999_04860 [Vitreimonas sp.]|nr:hypothetical protein [Vitreimonas sp.]
MIEILLVLLIILWLTGNLSIPGLVIPDFGLMVINGRMISLWDLLTFILILWILGLLPSPFREIAGILLILWVLSILGILAFAGLSNLLVIAIIVGIVASLFRR